MKMFVLGVIIASLVWVSVMWIDDNSRQYYGTVNTSGLIDSGFLEPSDNFSIEMHIYTDNYSNDLRGFNEIFRYIWEEYDADSCY